MRRGETRARRLAFALLLAVVPSGVAAQVNEPLHGAVIDARGVWARLKEDAAIADAIGVTPVNLPTRGLGVLAGAHWYPVRWRGVTLGIGGELLLAGDTRTLAVEEEEEEEEDEDTAVEQPTVSTRLTAASPHLSLNFGRQNGWSYISGGIGVAGFTAERVDRPVGDAPGRVRATHYGGGARWFIKKHLALSVDLRFYTIDAQPATADRPAYPRMRLTIISVGAAFR